MSLRLMWCTSVVPAGSEAGSIRTSIGCPGKRSCLATVLLPMGRTGGHFRSVRPCGSRTGWTRRQDGQGAVVGPKQVLFPRRLSMRRLPQTCGSWLVCLGGTRRMTGRMTSLHVGTLLGGFVAICCHVDRVFASARGQLSSTP